MRRGLAVVILWGFLSAGSCGSVWLVADSNMPDPNQEVTVFVHTDAPLYLLSLWAQAVGDANVTAVMGPADCNQYGWEPGWNIDGYYDSDGWVALGGVAWPNEANDVVGYFRFTYHGGQVAVSIAGEWSIGFDTDCQPAVFSTAPLLIGEPDPNQMMQGGGPDRSMLEIEGSEQIATESIELPPLAPLDPNKPRPGLLLCPLDGGIAKTQVKSPLKVESGVPEALAGEGGESLMELDLPIVEINSDITTNQIWTADNIYYVTANVNVQALLVIEPATLVGFHYDGGLIVNNGGTLISAGTPDEPVIYTSSATTFGRAFRREDFPQNCNSKMVVSIGDKKLEKAKEQCWRAAIEAGMRKGFNPIFLGYKDCTWQNLKYCLLLDKVQIWYHVGHGNYKYAGQPERTGVTVNGAKVFSYLKKDYGPNVPPTYEPMSWYYENNPSLGELALVNSHKLTFVQINACYSAKKSDFPDMLGMASDFNNQWYPPGKQIYIGWQKTVLVRDILGSYNQFEEDYWRRLRDGDTVQRAVLDSTKTADGLRILQNFGYWGAMYEYKKLVLEW